MDTKSAVFPKVLRQSPQYISSKHFVYRSQGEAHPHSAKMLDAKTSSYHRISKEEDVDEEAASLLRKSTVAKSRLLSQWRVSICATLINVTLLLIFIAAFNRKSTSSSYGETNCSPREQSAFCKLEYRRTPRGHELILQAPVFDKINIRLHDEKVNGTFWPQNPPSMFQQRPSPAIDAAWDRIGNLFPIPLSASDIKESGKNSDQCFRYPPEVVGGRSDVYQGMLDVFHQIHCLDMFRRVFWTDYYGDPHKWSILAQVLSRGTVLTSIFFCAGGSRRGFLSRIICCTASTSFCRP